MKVDSQLVFPGVESSLTSHDMLKKDWEKEFWNDQNMQEVHASNFCCTDGSNSELLNVQNENDSEEFHLMKKYEIDILNFNSNDNPNVRHGFNDISSVMSTNKVISNYSFFSYSSYVNKDNNIKNFEMVSQVPMAKNNEEIKMGMYLSNDDGVSIWTSREDKSGTFRKDLKEAFSYLGKLVSKIVVRGKEYK